MYGFDSLIEDADRFVKEGKDKIAPCSRKYEVNPYVYQYDLEVESFLNYKKIVKNETKWLERKLSKSQYRDDRLSLEFRAEMVEKFGTGIPREEHFWNACSIRWPESTINGAKISAFVREPWAEDFIKALTDYEYVICFGGSGQGKTHRALAFMCIGWDHFIDTQKGGRGLISTVNEDKIKQSTWPYLQMIYKDTVGSPHDLENREPISLYAGRGKISGAYTVRRPNDLKGGGVMQCILIPKTIDQQAVDKITGAHGHPFGQYHIDEAQSTPEAPIKASPNFAQNCDHSYITASGNYDLETDSLGKNTQPIQGWDKVDSTTHIYESINMLGIKTLCIHYNNELSPAMTKTGAKKWGHILPTKKKRDDRYPSVISKKTDEYRRFWLGWRKKRDSSDSVLRIVDIRESGCDGTVIFDPNYPIVHGWSFDSATGSIDRNILTHFADGICSKTGLWKVHIYECKALDIIENRLAYVRKTCDDLMHYSDIWGVNSGNCIMDWTNVTGIPENLLDRGFVVRTIGYGESPPDGVTKNKRTKRLDPAIIVDYDTKKYAHEVATNLISVGAFVIQQLVLHGQLTGLSEALINETNSEHSFEEEICRRKFIKIDHSSYGERYQLEPKSTKGRKSSAIMTGFKERYGFSPDILDTIFQIGYYMVLYRKMLPGSRKSEKVTIGPDQSLIKPEERLIYSNSEIWNDDLIDVDEFEYS